MLKVKGTTVTHTRGDTANLLVTIMKELPDGTKEPYIPEEGDEVRFALSDHYDDDNPLILKDIPIDTMVLHLDPEDTEPIEFGEYVYDIQLTTSDGYVDTFIERAKWKLTEEVE